jgi:mRNA interferase MazF
MTEAAAALVAGLRRGTVVSVASAGVSFGKPRRAVVQAERWLQAHPSVTLCPLTSTLIEAPLVRIAVTPSPGNGLRKPSQLMVDKLFSVPIQALGAVVGHQATHIDLAGDGGGDQGGAAGAQRPGGVPRAPKSCRQPLLRANLPLRRRIRLVPRWISLAPRRTHQRLHRRRHPPGSPNRHAPYALAPRPTRTPSRPRRGPPPNSAAPSACHCPPSPPGPAGRRGTPPAAPPDRWWGLGCARFASPHRDKPVRH